MTRPDSTRAISMASSPNGRPPASFSACQSVGADAGSVIISKPSSPLNLVRRMVAVTPPTCCGAGSNR